MAEEKKVKPEEDAKLLGKLLKRPRPKTTGKEETPAPRE